MKPGVLVLRTAGTNCDKETEFAFNLAGAKTERLHINRIKEKNNISDFQIICLPGGFTYGDNLGAGKILSLEILLWFKESLKEFLKKGGLILGICNGFQVLVKTGILPDLDFKQKVTLSFNDSLRFEDRWTFLRLPVTSGGQTPGANAREPVGKNIWFRDLPEIINLPVAHGEGKFYAQGDILDTIETGNQVVLRYTDKNGKLAGYPDNPNGSLNNIAGITDKEGKILGLMPHPERFIFKHHYPYWRKEDVYPFGKKIFENAVNYFK